MQLNDQNSTESTAHTVHRLCGRGKFALPGSRCAPCPQVIDSPTSLAPWGHLAGTRRQDGFLGAGLAAVQDWQHVTQTPCTMCLPPCAAALAERGVCRTVSCSPASAGILWGIYIRFSELRARIRVPWCELGCSGCCGGGTAGCWGIWNRGVPGAPVRLLGRKLDLERHAAQRLRPRCVCGQRGACFPVIGLGCPVDGWATHRTPRGSRSCGHTLP